MRGNNAGLVDRNGLRAGGPEWTIIEPISGHKSGVKPRQQRLDADQKELGTLLRYNLEPNAVTHYGLHQ